MSRAPARKNYVKVKMWTGDGNTLETEGGSLGVMHIMFSALTDDQHDKLLAMVKESRDKRKADALAAEGREMDRVVAQQWGEQAQAERDAGEQV